MATFCKRIKNAVRQEYEELLKVRGVADFSIVSGTNSGAKGLDRTSAWNDKHKEQHIKGVMTCSLRDGNWETDADRPSTTDESGDQAPPPTTTGSLATIAKACRRVPGHAVSCGDGGQSQEAPRICRN